MYNICSANKSDHKEKWNNYLNVINWDFMDLALNWELFDWNYQETNVQVLLMSLPAVWPQMVNITSLGLIFKHEGLLQGLTKIMNVNEYRILLFFIHLTNFYFIFTLWYWNKKKI